MDEGTGRSEGRERREQARKEMKETKVLAKYLASKGIAKRRKQINDKYNGHTEAT